jgi:signal transduction histidine kinase
LRTLARRATPRCRGRGRISASRCAPCWSSSPITSARKDDLRASEVIRRIRALLRKRELAMLPLGLNEVVDEVRRLLAASASRHNVVLETEFAADLPAVRGDRVHLQQVVLKLLLNAIDAMVDTRRPSGASSCAPIATATGR